MEEPSNSWCLLLVFLSTVIRKFFHFFAVTLKCYYEKKKDSLVETMLKQCLLFKVPQARLNTTSKVTFRSSDPDFFYQKLSMSIKTKLAGKKEKRKTSGNRKQKNNFVPVFFLIKCQDEGLQPYFKRDFDTIFVLWMLSNFLNKSSWTKQCRQILEVKQK